ncbi:hypothetical protein [Chryseobacterium sp. Marseille-Q8038]
MYQDGGKFGVRVQVASVGVVGGIIGTIVGPEGTVVGAATFEGLAPPVHWSTVARLAGYARIGIWSYL